MVMYKVILERFSMHVNKYIIAPIGLLAITTISGAFLMSSYSYADDSVVDEVNITVPVSCTMSGTGMNSHNASIVNGTYQADIGTTTLKAFCNDNNGFAIYATGYTGDEIGAENSNKLVGTPTTIGNISTGTATSGSTSNWAMKLATISSPTPTYPITIDNSFNTYQEVPNSYTKVAHRDSSTDIGSSAIGSELITTYATYISQTQGAGTYAGKVIYTLVHPSTDPAPVKKDQIGVNYDGNGLTFAGGASTNRVVYTTSPMYIAVTPQIVKSSNVDIDGNQNGAYGANELTFTPITATGASKMKVVLRYGISNGTLVGAAQGVWNGDFASLPENYEIITNESDGEATYVFEGDTVTVGILNEAGESPSSGHDYGLYAKIYPIYTTEQPGTEMSDEYSTSLIATSGTYAETTTWKGKWYITNNDTTTFLENEAAVISYLEQNSNALLGTNINIYAYNPYRIVYHGNNATAGTMTGFTINMDTTSFTADLTAPNFKRNGYGFVGWSENQNATVNGSDKIYGPNEKVVGTDLNFNSSTHETTLYAVWIKSAGTLQNWNECGSMNIGDVTALTDNRDDDTYAVAKLKDGNCWMIENLRLADKDASNNDIELSNTNTHNPSLPLTNSWWYSSSNDSDTKPTSNKLSASINPTTTAWCTTNNSNCYDQSMLYTGNITDFTTNTSSTKDSNIYSYGNYYNWYSATAGHGKYANGSGYVAPGDICPAGWHLPKGGNKSQESANEFWQLIVRLNGGTKPSNYDSSSNPYYTGTEATPVSNALRSYPNNFVYSGDVNGSTVYFRGSSGYYWSSSAGGNNFAYFLGFSSSDSVYPGTGGYGKDSGRMVRCVSGV